MPKQFTLYTILEYLRWKFGVFYDSDEKFSYKELMLYIKKAYDELEEKE